MQQKLVRIKKYDNRRLYDLEDKKYISLENVRRMIVDGREIQVTENSTGQDITKQILLQLLLELPPDKVDSFPAVYLYFLIRSPAGLLKDYFGNFFEQQLTLFLNHHDQYLSYLNEMSGSVIGSMPGGSFANPFQQLWNSFAAFGQKSRPDTAPQPDEEPDQPAPASGEVAELKKMLDQLSRKISDLEKKQ
ncbi:MAG: polyhydroxyalkanoate synthesis regulator DNA-binding domain-containing protein [Candidatus Wallbacteria bacterium]|nr:polyhydroxyalkanoate synthesis regulator DNA-binding domain-containing protein [Candidatus Wallbacteria bacterium]